MARQKGIKPRRIDRRNPFPWGSQGYGFFIPLIKGNGRASRSEMVDACRSWREKCGFSDKADLSKMLSVYLQHWNRDAAGTSYMLEAHAEGKEIVCTKISGIPFEQWMKGKIR